MRRPLPVPLPAIALLVIAVGPAGLSAQRARAAASAAPVTQAGSPAAAHDDKRAMTVADYALWRSVRDVAISDDGVWASFGYQQRRVDDTLFVKNLATGAEQRIPRASRAQFSDDSKWIAYFVSPPVRPNAPETDAPQNAPARVEVRNLANGNSVGWENVASFAFSKGSAALLVRKARPGAGPDVAAGRGGRGGAPPAAAGGRGAAAPARVDGTDAILHHLADGIDEPLSSVSAAEFNHAGTMLAYTVSATDRDGNGLYLVAVGSWQRRTLDNARADYARLTWDDSGTAVAVLRGTDRRGYTERENTLVAYAGLDGPEPSAFVLDRKQLAGLPDTMVLSEKGTLSWSPDHGKLFVGLKPQEAAPARRDSTAAVEPVGNVDVWHWKDAYIQPVQMVRAQQDRNRTFTASVILAQKKVVPLADDRMDRVQITKGGEWAIGQDDKEYVDDWKPQLNDFYRVNTNSGERTPIIKAQERSLGVSPDGRYLLYWKDKHVWAYDLAANKHVNVTRAAPVSFVNAEEDHVGEKPAYGIAGFTKDGKSVVLEHKDDLWLVSLDGAAAPRDLTGGIGSKDGIRFRYVRLEPDENGATAGPGGFGGGRGGAGASTVIDLSKPVLLSAFGETSKQAGFYRLDNGAMSKLVYENRSFGRPIKARNADRVLITRETFAEFPDSWVTDSRFANPQRLTEANPQQAQFRWGHRVLIDYKDKDGHKLQGTLAVPDSYQPGQKLPMLVYFYEKLSDNQNHYEVPRYASGPQYADYVSNGYLVLLPDIYFHTGRSHTDMLNSVEAAVRRVEELGYADPKRVGLHGGSYSGQGGAYISTQSKMFAAIAIRAAAVDLVADFNQLWKTTGTNQHRYDTYGQGRFGTNPYDNLSLFMDQSAVFHAQTMNTPLLIFQGTNDGSTEWLQGVEFYNALRFLKKPVIFLSYEGEGHGFTRYDNQYDVEVRMHQFYDHYLKGEPAAEWIANGVPFIKKKTPTGAAAQPVQLMGGGAGIGTPTPGGSAAGGGNGGGIAAGGPPNP
ncbi:MAG TPA: prolyl oligopeptidase family serine peptidase [Gemmatimonadaceae bacterium]|nr:prolyl oligopeptidase family serine peptidase [Gemmatimonadaceae bacterium]